MNSRRMKVDSGRAAKALFSATALAAILFTVPADALETIARQAILIESKTGEVLFERDADMAMAPASMSKMMTVLMVFERLADSSLSLDDTFRVSENAWRKGGAKSGSSTMFLEPGTRVAVEKLLRGIIVQSGNDASIVVAEGLTGGEEPFAELMNRRGREIGMSGTMFKNATGWPHEDHRTTARDLARLAGYTIKKFPQYYRYYAERSFTYNGIRQGNRNPLLYKNMGADGLKTGHTKESGYGLTGTAVRKDRRLILVINGLPSNKSRAREAERLLEWGFREFENYALFENGETVTDADVWLGTAPTVPLVIEEGLVLTLPRKARSEMKATVSFQGPIAAPIAAGDEVAILTITAPGIEAREIPLRAGADVEQLGLIGRLGAALKYILWGASS